MLDVEQTRGQFRLNHRRTGWFQDLIEKTDDWKDLLASASATAEFSTHFEPIQSDSLAILLSAECQAALRGHWPEPPA
jgi:hypothetical protein